MLRAKYRLGLASCFGWVDGLDVSFSEARRSIGFGTWRPLGRGRRRSYTHLRLLDRIEPTGGIFIVDSSKHRVVRLIRECQTIKGREKESKFLVEGAKYILQALLSDVSLSELVMSERAYRYQLAKDEEQMKGGAIEEMHPEFGPIPLLAFGQGSVSTYVVKDSLMKALYPNNTPQMVALAFKLHGGYKSLEPFKNMRKILALDSVVHPKNVGMIMRTAEAFGVEGVLLLTAPNALQRGNMESVIYSRLAINASRGAIFRVPFLHVKRSELLEFAKDTRFELVCSLARRPSLELPEWKKNLKRNILIIGNESDGVRDEILKQANSWINIPVETESLNVAVACGILLYKLYGD